MKLNRIEIIGRLVRDAEIKMSQKSGKIRQYFSIAFNDDFKKQGTEEWIKRVYYFNCYSWKEYEGMFKGTKVFIVGKLVNLTYEDKKTGEKKNIPYIEVASLDFMADNKPAQAQPEQQIEQQAEQPQQEISDEECPF